jgi:hypothetical protein
VINSKIMLALSALVIFGGLASGSVLAVEISDEDYKLLQAYKETLANKQQPPHKAAPVSDEDYLKLQALKKKEAEQQQPAHQTPHKAEPPTGGHANLAAAATNPIANLMQFQVQDAYNWENHNSDGYSNATILQSVIPVKLPWKSVPLLITRATLPYVTTPDLGDPINDRKSGFGDTDFLALAVPKLKTKGVQVGLGFNSVFPTAGANGLTGNGKYQLGPAGLYLNMQTPSWQWGLFGYQLWDIGSGRDGSDRDGVSKLSIQPVLTKHFAKGWYVASPDTPQTYDFNAEKWTWALGAQAGRVQKIGKQPVKWFGEILYNPEDDNGPTAEWTFKANLTFLFPE